MLCYVNVLLQMLYPGFMPILFSGLTSFNGSPAKISPSVFNSPFGHGSCSHKHPPNRQPPLWFIDIALKLGAQLSILTSTY